MIARQWRAYATREGARRYRGHFAKDVLPELRSLDGFQTAYVLEKDQAEQVEIRVITLWASLEKIRDFAGDDISTAVVEPAAKAVLTEYWPTVEHYRATEYRVPEEK